MSLSGKPNLPFLLWSYSNLVFKQNVREQIFETSFPSWYSFRTQYYQYRKTIPAPEFHAKNIPGRRRGKFLFLFVNFIRDMGEILSLSSRNMIHFSVRVFYSCLFV
jgi:hypothetical protein